jgi:uncharacterized NAD(P)/FAD-binding protein YdhS
MTDTENPNIQAASPLGGIKLDVGEVSGTVHSYRDPTLTWVAVIGTSGGGAEFLESIVQKLANEDIKEVGILLIDPQPPENDGRGVAWTHHQPEKLLANMHVDKIGTVGEEVYKGEPDSSSKYGSSGALFKSRVEFGRRLHAKYRKTVDHGLQIGLKISRIQARVCAIKPENRLYSLELHSSREREMIYVDYVVFAIGHFPPTNFKHLSQYERYIKNPWDWNTIPDPNPHEVVGLIGIGPTAVDVITALNEKGFQGYIESYSRTGICQFPRPKYDSNYQLKVLTREVIHEIYKINGNISIDMVMSLVISEMYLGNGGVGDLKQAGEALLLSPQAMLSEALKWVNTEQNWFSVLKAFDDITPLIWHCMDNESRNVYLRMYRKFHTNISYGMSSEQAINLLRLINNGRLTIFKGLGEISIGPGENRFDVRFGNGTAQRNPDYLINCSGLGTDVSEIEDPLIQSLLQQGLAVRHEFGGVLTDFFTGQLLSADGKASGPMYALAGTLTSGTYLLTD